MEEDSEETGRDLNELQNADWVGFCTPDPWPLTSASICCLTTKFKSRRVQGNKSIHIWVLHHQIFITVFLHTNQQKFCQNEQCNTAAAVQDKGRLTFSNSSLPPLAFDRPARLDAGSRWWGACVKGSSWRRCRSASTTLCPSSTSSPPTRCSWTTSGPNATNCAKSWFVLPASPFSHTLSQVVVLKSYFCLCNFKVKGDIPPRLKKSAHEVILEFIRSRPPLNPVRTEPDWPTQTIENHETSVSRQFPW